MSDAHPLFNTIRESRQLFVQVRVNPASEIIEWPGEVDLDPEVLCGRSELTQAPGSARRTLREPGSAAE
jgi:hypothetical protein